MTLGNFLGKIDEYVDVVVYNVYGDVIGMYDGRNSISDRFDLFDVFDFCVTHEKVIVWVEEV